MVRMIPDELLGAQGREASREEQERKEQERRLVEAQERQFAEALNRYLREEENDRKKNGAKDDNGKPKLSTVPTGIIYAIEKVRAYGFAKYGEAENWKSIAPERWHEALLRHVLRIWNDPMAIDPESGLPHLYHIAWNVDAMIESLHLTPDELEAKKGE